MLTSQEINKSTEVDDNIKKVVEECLSLVTDNKLVLRICEVVVKVLSERNKPAKGNSADETGNTKDA